MRVIITGGTGLIGRALSASLLADGHEVVVLTRRPTQPHPNGALQGARLVTWDGRTASGWQNEVEGAGAIVNLAGVGMGDGPWTAARKKLIVSSRVSAGRAVAAAVQAASARPPVVVQSSAVGYYGPSGEETITEDSPSGSDFLAEVCRQWEASSAAVEDCGVRRVITRTGVVLSLDGGALPKMLLPFKLFVGGPLGSGRQFMSWIHMADEVAAIRYLIDQANASGPYDLTAPQPVTNADFSRAIGRVMRRPALVPAPAFALRLALGEMSTMLLEGQRVMPRRLQEAGFTFRFETVDEALQDVLGR